MKIEPKSNVIPIVVVGMGRSGTKGLTNEIGRHRDVAIVADDSHYGVMISPIFEVFPAKFNLQLPDEYVAAVAVLMQTDFVKHTGIEDSFFYSLQPRPKDFVILFRALMDEYARRKGSTHWVQKTSPRGIWMFKNRYEGVKLVFIKRALIANVRSRIGAQMRLDSDLKKMPNLIRAVAHYVVDEKLIRKIRTARPSLLIDFEKYKCEPGQIKRDIAEYVGLSDGEFDFEPPYPRNTSFDGNLERGDVLSRIDTFCIWTLYFSLKVLPLSILYTVREKLMSRITPMGPGAFNKIRFKFKF